MAQLYQDSTKSYVYSLANDLGGILDLTCLQFEICDAISCNMDGMSLDGATGDELVIMFVEPLTSQEEEDLDTIIANHDGGPCPEFYDTDIDSQTAEYDVERDSDIGFIAEIDDSSLSSTNSANWVRKLRLILNNLPQGRYRVGWFYMWRLSSTKYDFEARIQINDNDTLFEHQQEPKDSGKDQRNQESGFKYITLDTGNYNIDFDYKQSYNDDDDDDDTAYIWDVRIEVWRIS